MKYQRHGITVGIDRIESRLFVRFKIEGKLTHADYELFVPMLEGALAEVSQPKVRALVDLLDFQGFEARAAWDDLKLGLKHGREFERIALVGNKSWQKVAAQIGGWFTGGEVRLFEDSDSAYDWLTEQTA
ncbi:MAG: STAS/SEC14 domain-containing protein [marine bacterium B5-7]|nr:MAG: STAS/SEC14 domain-containing protein [marine bacterium B5-7]